MLKAFKILFLSLLTIGLLLMGLLFASTLLLNPNDYRQQIEYAVEQHTGVKIRVGGNLAWSFYPWLGIEMNHISIHTRTGTPFTEFSQMQVRVELLSLLRRSPRVGKLVIDGLKVDLIKNELGQKNWEALSKAKSAADSNPVPDSVSASSSTTPPPTSSDQRIDFAVSEVAILNAQVRYQDLASATDFLITPINLTAKDIRTEVAFPVSIEFRIQDEKSGLFAENNLKTEIMLDQRLTKITLSPLSGTIHMSGGLFGEKAHNLELKSQISLDQAAGKMEIQNTQLSLKDWGLNLNLQVSSLDSPTPQIQGNFSIPGFSLKALMADLGLPPIQTAQPSALNNLGLTSTIHSKGNEILLPDAVLLLDETRFATAISYNKNSGRIRARLEGDTLNADHYLPPPTADGDLKSPVPQTPEGSAAQQGHSDALPIDTLKTLNVDIYASLKKLTVKNLAINDLVIQSQAQNGVITLDRATGQLYGGNFLATARAEVAKPVPTWHLSEEIDQVSLLPFLGDLKQWSAITGRVNLKSELQSTGNTLSQIRQQAKGVASFQVDEGTLEGVNLKAIACQGVARLSGKQVDTATWPTKTEFTDFKGSIEIQGPLLTNPMLIASLSGVSMEGGGTVDTLSNQMSYGLGLKVLGELGDPNCQINKHLRDLSIPVRCGGELGGKNIPKCGLDTEKLSKMIEQIARKEAETKLDKVLDKQLDKLFSKKKEQAPAEGADVPASGDTPSPSSEKNQQKEAVKDLIKGIFK